MDKWYRTRSVGWQQFDGVGILLDPQGQWVHELNPTALHLWVALEAGATESALVDSLLREFDVDPAVAAEDVAATLGHWRALGLVEGRGDSAP